MQRLLAKPMRVVKEEVVVMQILYNEPKRPLALLVPRKETFWRKNILNE
jgi:hypothetical protein